jgi:hypothetical protein
MNLERNLKILLKIELKHFILLQVKFDLHDRRATIIFTK